MSAGKISSALSFIGLPRFHTKIKAALFDDRQVLGERETKYQRQQHLLLEILKQKAVGGEQKDFCVRVGEAVETVSSFVL